MKKVISVYLITDNFQGRSKMIKNINIVLLVTSVLLVSVCSISQSQELNRVFPEKEWIDKKPQDVGLNQKKIDKIAALLQGRGCIIRHGYVVKTWGNQSVKGDWLSSSKPVFSTLLFFAIQEGKIDGVNTLIKDFGWDLVPKDESMSFHHLANMISGYARPEKPGMAWAYNDYAINLYRLTLFNRLFRQNPDIVANHPDRLGQLRFQDGLSFSNKARVIASVRDFARLCWFWLNKGKWGNNQLLRSYFFDTYVRPHVPKNLLHTSKAETNDYLNIKSYGGGSDHFTNFGPGIYGYNFWFNNTGKDHPEQLTWPDAPRDAYMTIGAGGNSSVIIPCLDMVIVASKASWGNIKPGDPDSQMNQVMKLAVEAVFDARSKNNITSKQQCSITGELKKWHTITLSFQGPESNEMADNPNPFIDYRLHVLLKGPSGQIYNVPGFFDRW